MPFLKSKKSHFDEEEEHDLFCGEEMKPFVAYPRGEEEQRTAPVPEPIAAKQPEEPLSRGRRFWNLINGMLVLK